jgi:hypothetical protein
VSSASVTSDYLAPPRPYATGQWKWILVLSAESDHPNPTDPQHEANWQVENSDGWNVSYEQRLGIYITSSGTTRPNTNNIISFSEDFTDAQKASADQDIDNLAHARGLLPPTESMSQFKQGDASIKYNCHAYTTNNTSFWVNSDWDWIKPFSFPVSSQTDWREPYIPQLPTLAGHEKLYFCAAHEHTSKVSTVNEQRQINGQLVTVQVTYYTGKYCEAGIYRTPIEIVQGFPNFGAVEDYYVWK